MIPNANVFVDRLMQATFFLTLSSILLSLLVHVLNKNSAKLWTLSGWLPLIQGVLFFSIVVRYPKTEIASSDVVVSPPSVGRIHDINPSSRLISFPSLAEWSQKFSPMEATTSDFVFEPGSFLAVLWIAGCILISFYWIRSYRTAASLFRFRDERQVKTSALAEHWQQLLVEQNIRQKIPLVETNDFGPALCLASPGYSLLVPSSIESSMTRKEIEVILRHELAHYQERHIPKLLLARMLVLANWFNPVAWYCLRRIEYGYECRADDMAIRGSSNGSLSLAKSLLMFAEQRNRAVAISIRIGGSHLKSRIGRVLNPNWKKESNMKVLLLLLFGVLMASASVIRLQPVVVAAEKLEPYSLKTSPPSPHQSNSSSKDWRIFLEKMRESSSSGKPIPGESIVEFLKATTGESPLTISVADQIGTIRGISKITREEKIWYCQDNEVAYRFEIDPDKLLAYLIEVCKLANFPLEEILQGMKEDPLGPHFDLCQFLKEDTTREIILILGDTQNDKGIRQITAIVPIKHLGKVARQIAAMWDLEAKHSKQIPPIEKVGQQTLYSGEKVALSLNEKGLMIGEKQDVVRTINRLEETFYRK